jgi:OOP family OmpA-OmpF porin
MLRLRKPVVVLFGILAVAAAAFGQEDREGTKDYPGIKRMPSFYIDIYKDVQFESATFSVTKGGQRVQQAVEGHWYQIGYYLKNGAPQTSALQIIRNHQNAVKAIGGQVLDDEKGGNYYNTTLRFSKEGKEVWVLVEARDDNYALTIVERQAMDQDVAIDAAAMANGIETNGSIALYGIYFDTAKSDLKPESEPTLAEMAKLLQSKPDLKVFVVGHTDMVGDPAANLKLSLARAQSVIGALAAKGIAASRMTAFGNGSYAPIASNRTAEGRGKNRRVELVEVAVK